MQQSSAARSETESRQLTNPTRRLERGGVPVVLFEGTLTGTGVARILNAQGIRAYSVMNDPGIYRHSRHYLPAPGLPPKTSPAKIASALEQLKVPQAVLMPCADDWLLTVGSLHLNAHDRFFACVPPLEAIETVMDKWNFAQAVYRLGVPHPHTRMISSVEELLGLSDDQFRGHFLKPVNSLEFSRTHGVKALVVHDKASALSSTENISFPIMLQEYIPGPATAHYFLDGFIDRNGRMCALFARRRLRMYPPKVGNSSLLVSIPVQDIQHAADSLQRILDNLRYRGIFSAEFKYDERDGEYKILEVNARPWWYVEFAAQCGVDVCAMAYRDALGMEVKPVFDYRIGCRCVHLSNDIAGFLHHADGFPGSFFSWAKSVVGAYDAIFRWSDPGPSIAFAFDRLTRHRGKA